MPTKQFWDYIVTVEIRVSAADREEAKQIVKASLFPLSKIVPDASIAIVRVRPIIKK